jgi:hypothetical protein
VVRVGRRRFLPLGSLRGRGRRSERTNACYDGIDLVNIVNRRAPAPFDYDAAPCVASSKIAPGRLKTSIIEWRMDQI